MNIVENVVFVKVPVLHYIGYTQDALVALSQRVKAYNNGAKCVIVCNEKVLKYILPIHQDYKRDKNYVNYFMGNEVIIDEILNKKLHDIIIELELNSENEFLYVVCFDENNNLKNLIGTIQIEPFSIFFNKLPDFLKRIIFFVKRV